MKGDTSSHIQQKLKGISGITKTIYMALLENLEDMDNFLTPCPS